MNRLAVSLICLALGMSPFAQAGEGRSKLAQWSVIENNARGQTVYWNAWAGERAINNYIAWAAREAEKRFGVKVQHVKLSDTSEAVAKVIAEKAAGRDTGGSVDLIWINGENFASLKSSGLLFGPWAEQLPNYRLVDTQNRAVTHDFTIPTEGYEAPWDLAQLVFYHDAARLENPPKTIEAILDYAKGHPGRIAYPDAQNFLGATFLKQALIELGADRAVLQRPVDGSNFDAVTAPLWSYLDKLHPYLWRRGRVFPANSAEMRQLLADREIDVAFSFNPAEASLAVANHELPESVRSYVPDRGAITNASFLAIPFNAAHKEGAMVLANFLISPEAQARKENPAIWGGLTVLGISKLAQDEKRAFEHAIAEPAPKGVAHALEEPHPSWMVRISHAWLERYASQ